MTQPSRERVGKRSQSRVKGILGELEKHTHTQHRRISSHVSSASFCHGNRPKEEKIKRIQVVLRIRQRVKVPNLNGFK